MTSSFEVYIDDIFAKILGYNKDQIITNSKGNVATKVERIICTKKYFNFI